MAGVCSADSDFQFLKTYSNYKCGNYGVYMLDMTGEVKKPSRSRSFNIRSIHNYNILQIKKDIASGFDSFSFFYSIDSFASSIDEICIFLLPYKTQYM